MSFPVPSFSDLDASIAADLRGLENADPLLRVSVLFVLRKVLARLGAGEYAYLASLVDRALMPDSVEGIYLDRQAGNVGIERLLPTPSSGTVQFTGTVDIPLDAGSQMQDGSGQVTLATTAIATIGSGGTLSVPVQSVTTGSAANLAAGAPVTLLIGIAGISATGTVLPAGGSDPTAGLVGGTDEEDDAALHVRYAARLSNPPQGGAAYDFEAWAKTVNGVTRVWVYPLQTGPGTVSITFCMDGRANPIPLAADVVNVQAAIDAKRPVIGTATVFTSTAVETAVTVSNLSIKSGYTLATVQASIAASVAALNYITVPGVDFLREKIYQAIANTAGVDGFDLTAPAGDIAVTFGELVQLQAPTFA